MTILFPPLRVLLITLPVLILAVLLTGVPNQAVGVELPSITGDTWLNTSPLTDSDLKGKVVLIKFWTYGCHNCNAVEPYVIDWHKKYADKGLLVIAIHTPEFDREKQLDNVRAYLKKHGVPYPVVLDNDFSNWNRFSNRYWPTLYLADRSGTIRYRKIGEGHYKRTEQWIQDLLEEK
ncbi:MAG: redoxin domain-containing protein [Ectothiorhodospiraceae bacterium]|nr:redoxin domain-containing protein [Ectothiorhodospiraceae bacterium]